MHCKLARLIVTKEVIAHEIASLNTRMIEIDKELLSLIDDFQKLEETKVEPEIVLESETIVESDNIIESETKVEPEIKVESNTEHGKKLCSFFIQPLENSRISKFGHELIGRNFAMSSSDGKIFDVQIIGITEEPFSLSVTQKRMRLVAITSSRDTVAAGHGLLWAYDCEPEKVFLAL